jgi:hypothetical protein
MTIEELKKLQPTDQYLFLSDLWWQLEGMLAQILPDNEEGKQIWNTFASIRYDMHDLFCDEQAKRTD